MAHASVQEHGDLDLRQRLPTRGLVIAQRLAWLLLALLMLAGLAGAFGGGPLSHTQAGGPGQPLWARYERFGRYETANTLEVHLAPQLFHQGQAHLEVGRDLLEHYEIESVIPSPTTVVASARGQVYAFQVAQAEEPLVVVLRVVPMRVGPQTIRLGRPRAPQGPAAWDPGKVTELEMTQFVYP